MNVVLAIGVMLGGGLLGAGTVQAIPTPQSAGDSTIPYSATLADGAGNPVPDGMYSFTFSLYDSPDAGNLLWSETQTEVEVKGGYVRTVLGGGVPLPPGLPIGGSLWLSVSVRGPGEPQFTALTPRQQVNLAGAMAASVDAPISCPHNHFAENWTGTNSARGLIVDNSGTGDGIRAYTRATAENYAGLYAGAIGKGSGVYAFSDGGMAGVFRGATAGDSSGTDNLGDIKLLGERGEIFAAGSRLNLYSNYNVTVHLDNDRNDASSGPRFAVINGTDSDVFWVLENGNMVATGTKSAAVETQDFGQRLMYAIEATEVWFEDIGTAALSGGEATVTLDPTFAQTVDLAAGYQVFVTPVSDQPVVLYVTAKAPTGFTVRGVTLDGQAATAAFDYRVVAHRRGYEALRMEAAATMEGGSQ
jgi:hypothetical protein